MTRYPVICTIAILFLFFECHAWTYHKAPFATLVRGGASEEEEDTEEIDDDDYRPQKKRKMTREEIIADEDDLYESDEWFDASREFSSEEESFIVEEASGNGGGGGEQVEDDEEVGYDDDAQPEINEEVGASSYQENKQQSDNVSEHQEMGGSGSSSAENVDRMELADAYDDDMAVITSEPPTVIDAQTERILKHDLKYSKREIAQMKPAVATVVAAKRLHRPLEGMPRNWYVSPPQKAEKIRWQPVVRKLIVPITVGVFVITQGETTLDLVTTVFSRFRKPKESQEEETRFPVEDDDPYATALGLEDHSSTTEPLPDHKPHSIKPGQHPDNELDVTWLDKFLTAVERKLKAFLRWKI